MTAKKSLPTSVEEYLASIRAQRDALIEKIRLDPNTPPDALSTYMVGTGARYEAGKFEDLADEFGRLTALDRIEWILAGVLKQSISEVDRVRIARMVFIEHLGAPENENLPQGFFDVIDESHAAFAAIVKHARSAPALSAEQHPRMPT